jgi:hypothetical protein
LARIECERRIGLTPEQIEGSVLFRDWTNRFDPGWRLRKFRVVSGVATKNTVHMLFAEVTMRDPDNMQHSRLAFLRGGTVDVLAIVTTPDGCEHVVHIEEKRVAVGQTFVTNPAGMTDGDTPVLTATREFGEEVDDSGEIAWAAPVSLNEKLFGANLPMPASPGGTNEVVFFYLRRGAATYGQLKKLDGSVKGLITEGERTIVRVTPVEDAMRALAHTGRPDLKATTSLLIYQSLQRSGTI